MPEDTKVEVVRHTPRPWRVENSSRVVDARGAPVAIVFKWDDPLAHRANLDLIAAAPDLLHALKEMREHAEYSNPYGEEAFRRAEAAIAKAEGKQ